MADDNTAEPNDVFSDDAATEAAATAAAEQAVVLDIERLLTEREQYQSERDEFKSMALRLQADFENYRKRAERQANENAERAITRLVEELLPVLDACDLAKDHGVHGIDSVRNALLGALRKHGLEPMDAYDKPFDPSLQEAVAHEPGDGGDPIVSQVLRTGYTWKGRVLRPAMVKVRG